MALAKYPVKIKRPSYSIEDLERMKKEAQKQIKELQTGMYRSVISQLRLHRKFIRDCNLLIRYKKTQNKTT